MKKTILLVADDDVVMELLRSWLGRDYILLEASRCLEVKEALSNLIDLAIVDYCLPDGDGFEILKVIKELKLKIPIIFMTAYSSEALAIKALRAGVTDYLKKPLNFAYLSGKLSEILEEMKNEKDIERSESRKVFIVDSLAAFLGDDPAKGLMREVDCDTPSTAACKLACDVTSPDTEHRPPLIKIFTLGRFGLLMDEEPLRFRGKTPEKQLALLKAIIAYGGREVPAEQLSEALWPDADGDVVCSSFRTTLHRLRHLLRSDCAIQTKDGKVSIDAKYCWVDAWRFQRMATEADSMWYKERHGCSDKGYEACRKKALILSEQAINSYGGDFLAGDIRYSWAIPMRERLKDKCIKLISKVSTCYEHSRQWKKARECYSRGLEIDAFYEEFYLRLIWCYFKEGRRSEALTLYDRCCTVLSTLGIEPSAETKVLVTKVQTHI
jgi:two-component SAPR family response regulator